MAELGINGKDAVTMSSIYNFKRHGGSAVNGIFIAAGRTEAAFTAERNKFKCAAVRTAVHGTAKGRVAAVNHFIDIFHLSISGMKRIFNFFIIVSKNFL